jgi:hypothetical protein
MYSHQISQISLHIDTMLHYHTNSNARQIDGGITYYNGITSCSAFAVNRVSKLINNDRFVLIVLQSPWAPSAQPTSPMSPVHIITINLHVASMV